MTPPPTSSKPAPAAHPPPKPTQRGVWHQHAAVAAAAAGASLVGSAAGSAGAKAAWATAAYSSALTFMLATSALYHRPTWSPSKRAILRRVDHAAIFVLIFGTYVPLALLTPLPPGVGARLVTRVGAGAAAGVAAALAVPHVKPLAAALYVALGWAGAADAAALAAAMPAGAGPLILAGGITYTLGAITYAARWPNPAPRTFGYHEVFHAAVVVAAALHFAAVHLVAHSAAAGAA